MGKRAVTSRRWGFPWEALGLLLTALSLAAPRAAASQERADEGDVEGETTGRADERKVVEAVTGRWRFVGGDPEREALASEIEEVLDGMSFFKRPFARPRLQAGNDVPKLLVITAGDGVVGIDMDDNHYRAELGGTWKRGSGSGGSDLRYRHLVDRGHLVQVFHAKHGKRFNWFVRTGPDHLKMVVKVVSGHFSQPLVYELTYVREDSARGGARRTSSGGAS